ncbi:MAG: hypothetical protein KDA32_12625 [Phycisphaerales bacterium]|nr:hypothetical protein [Phycisphaerales bacterium]
MIEVICGCMFAGKTTALIARLEAARADGRRVIAFRHAGDDRYDAVAISTHDGRRFPSTPARDANELESLSDGFDVLGVDEAHFFGPELAEVAERLSRRGRRVIAVGLDYNAWGGAFEPFPALKRMADRVDALTAPCVDCGAPARYSQRVTPVLSPLMVGGVGDYLPKCLACFESLPGEPAC